MEPEEIRKLEDRIGYRFRDRDLLVTALTHSSFAHERRRKTGNAPRDNERLEFLGDAVVNLVAAELLMEIFPDADEGYLSRSRSYLVAEEPLAEAARLIDLGRWLRLGRGEEKTGGRDKASVLADALEALAAAIYLDSGLEAARRVLRSLLGPRVERLKGGHVTAVDPKSHLQEYLQARGQPLPSYRVLGREGPDHRAVFTVELVLADGRTFLGEGRSKREAEQAAARVCLGTLLGRGETGGGVP